MPSRTLDETKVKTDLDAGFGDGFSKLTTA
jgi:hypothetical protein